MHTRSLTGYGLVMVVAGLLTLFLRIHEDKEGTALYRTSVWLGFKIICFIIIRIWAKIACYATQDDVHSLLLLFIMVVAF